MPTSSISVLTEFFKTKENMIQGIRDEAHKIIVEGHLSNAFYYFKKISNDPSLKSGALKRKASFNFNVGYMIAELEIAHQILGGQENQISPALNAAKEMYPNIRQHHEARTHRQSAFSQYQNADAIVASMYVNTRVPAKSSPIYENTRLPAQPSPIYENTREHQVSQISIKHPSERLSQSSGYKVTQQNQEQSNQKRDLTQEEIGRLKGDGLKLCPFSQPYILQSKNSRFYRNIGKTNNQSIDTVVDMINNVIAQSTCSRFEVRITSEDQNFNRIATAYLAFLNSKGIASVTKCTINNKDLSLEHERIQELKNKYYQIFDKTPPGGVYDRLTPSQHRSPKPR